MRRARGSLLPCWRLARALCSRLYPFGVIAAGLVEVIIYSSPDDKKKNRGFCFLEYESHKAASLAKRRLGTGRIKVWDHLYVALTTCTYYSGCSISIYLMCHFWLAGLGL